MAIYRCKTNFYNAHVLSFFPASLNKRIMKMKKKMERAEKKMRWFQRKQIIDFLHINSFIFNFHFEFLIFIEKYDCVVCVVQRQRKKNLPWKWYISFSLTTLHLIWSFDEFLICLKLNEFVLLILILNSKILFEKFEFDLIDLIYQYY